MILAIDPGQKGGVACFDGSTWLAYPMPKTVKGIVNLIHGSTAMTGWDEQKTMIVERSQPMPKQGVSSVFSYGQHYGGFEAIAACLGLRYLTVRPTEWKKVMGLNSDKTSSIIEAERLFPEINLVPTGCRKPSDGIAEALLIGEYARRMNL